MSQYNSANLKTVGEESSMNDSDEDSDFTDTMSRLTMEDEDDVKDGEDDLSYDTGTMVSNQSDYQSNASKHGHSPTARARKSRRSSAKYEDKWYGTTSIGLPYVIDLWKNKTPQNVIISTDKRSVVLETFLPDNATETKMAFDSYIIGNIRRWKPDEALLLKTVLDIHPKTIARKNSIAKLRKRKPGKKQIVLTQRIPLPFKVKHQFSTKDSDALFYGKKFVPYKDGSIWLHLELL